jgi:hypothetical protein
MTPLRAQCLDEMLEAIRQYYVASPPFRHFWRVLALHEIARFKRWFLWPERRAFLVAVEKSKQRRAAA